MLVINGLKPCKPERTLTEQYSKAMEEMGELGEAIESFTSDYTTKKRAEIIFEAMDAVVAITSLLNMIFNENEGMAAVEYTNAKNTVRGYLKR